MTKESQSEKFKRAARELGADESDEGALDRALRKMRKGPSSKDKENQPQKRRGED